MADVLVTTIGRWVVFFALIRTIRIHEYGGWPAVAVWVPVCLAAWRWRAAHALLAIVAVVGVATLVPHNGIMSIAWLAAAVAIFSGEQLRLVLRVKATAVYAFTAANKLFPRFASGSVLASVAPWLPWPRAMALLVIYVEALLAVATWRRWPLAFPLAVVTHAGILLGLATGPLRLLQLLGWQVSMPVLVYYTTMDRPTAPRGKV